MDVNDFLIDEEKTMIEAMQQLDEVAKKVLFVVKENLFVAAITDGDIRRWILKKGHLDVKVKEIANYNPKYLTEKNKTRAKEFLKKHSIEAVPIVSKEKQILSIVLRNDEDIEMKKHLKVPVIIMAGGLGTRLYPYTKILPKPLIPIGEIPIVEHIINRFYRQGSDEFYLVVNHKKNMIKAYFNEIERNYEIHYADEKEPLGTGGGLSLLKGKMHSTFVLSNCDILIEEDYEKIYNYHKQENNLITMVCSLKNIKIPYGVIEISETGEIESMKEKPELSFFTNTGMYIVEPKIIEELEEGKSIGFPDIIEQYKAEGEKIGIYPIGEKSWMDMGQIDEMEEMRRRLERDG
ncbi:mannose-1-phosphate guanylyltransferase [Halolactibacillus alkaliphilus]|uniref:Mannose-1-phosphate guanylyltransferase n=1 Tax=Halolactibacillus alkaliphilus TaxID=442899 RepID=A0A511X2E1_9BACI|nr:sugar phosphate nucleotidyltransferase [Halolactibacillus alkaliphilus]GEN57108.1 mannose-1-phosphate guanylyltransferase [Halolactibacillus alkaliphilus]GGN71998.1 mannose-1-phosphate guanylyltransferase [Halolactibacillus alkaliphilus]SFO86703.1 Nucleotidyl transferase [Halolactibacillus alkaliphilus]